MDATSALDPAIIPTSAINMIVKRHVFTRSSRPRCTTRSHILLSLVRTESRVATFPKREGFCLYDQSVRDYLRHTPVGPHPPQDWHGRGRGEKRGSSKNFFAGPEFLRRTSASNRPFRAGRGEWLRHRSDSCIKQISSRSSVYHLN